MCADFHASFCRYCKHIFYFQVYIITFLDGVDYISLARNTIALTMNPLARGIEELLPSRISSTYLSFLLIRTSLILSSLLVAFLIPFFGRWPFLTHQINTRPSLSPLLVFAINCRHRDVSYRLPL